MSELGDAIDEVRSELEEAASEFRPGTCRIQKNTLVDGGSAGDTLTPSVGAIGIPYKCKSAGHQSQVVVGGKSTRYGKQEWPRQAGARRAYIHV